MHRTQPTVGRSWSIQPCRYKQTQEDRLCLHCTYSSTHILRRRQHKLVVNAYGKAFMAVQGTPRQLLGFLGTSVGLLRKTCMSSHGPFMKALQHFHGISRTQQYHDTIRTRYELVQVEWPKLCQTRIMPLAVFTNITHHLVSC